MEWKKSIDESWKESAEKEKEQLESLAHGAGGQKSDAGKGPSLTGGESSRNATGSGSEDRGASGMAMAEGVDGSPAPAGGEESCAVDFLDYVTGLAFQAMVFLGEIPNPMTNKTEKNLQQARFMIDTLVMMRGKTRGNLTKQESDTLNTAVYELQMKYVESASREGMA